ncbi:hypothetical protein [Lentzea sp. NPDC003310]|uniref:hypothetical protein n=1 Tax=Lentzea sp. NPDC003310 TaxID=3154447 RepID=UPI0033ADA14C
MDAPGLSGTLAAGPERAGVRVDPLPGEPTVDGGAEVRFPEDDEGDGVLLEELLEDVWAGAFGWTRFIDDATDWSVSRVVRAVSRVL